MRFLIIQPSWDHSEVLSSLLYFIKKTNNQVKIIYDWSHPEGNYLDYYCELFGFGDEVKLNYRSPKHHIKDFQNAHKIIFVDEIHLKKFLTKNVFLNFINKIYTFNHLTRKINWNIKCLSLGIVPFNRCLNEKKFLVNNYFNPNSIKLKLNNKIKYLIVGNPKYREMTFLESLNNCFDINIVIRDNLELTNKNIKIHKNLPTRELIKLISSCDYIITLFKKNSPYHKDRISGIIPFAVSFGKPVITDSRYSKKFGGFLTEGLVYNNNEKDFKKIMENSLKIVNTEYKKMVLDLINFRDIKIQEQYLNFHLIFN